MRKKRGIALLLVITTFILVGVAFVQHLLFTNTDRSKNIILNNTTTLEGMIEEVKGGEDGIYGEVGYDEEGPPIQINYYHLIIQGSENGSGGTSTPSSGYHQYVGGTTAEYTFTANEGYLIDSLKIKGVSVYEAAGKTTYSSSVTMDSDYLLEVTFSTKSSHSIEYNAQDVCGSMSGPSSAIFGDTVSVNLTFDEEACPLVSLKYNSPTSGEQSLVYVSGQPVTFSMPNSNTVVTAVFEPAAVCWGYAITVENGTGGSQCVEDGTELTLQPITIYGKRFLRWESNDIKIADPYNPVLNVTVSGRSMHFVAVFEDLPIHHVMVNCPSSELLEPAGCLNYHTTRFEGETVNFSITPKAGYYVSSVYKNGGSFYGPVTVGPYEDGSYKNTTYQVTGNCVFTFDIQKVLYSLNHFGSTTYGTITPSVTEAGVGDEVTFTVAPVDGYTLEKAYISYGADASYVETDITSTLKFTMPAEEVTYYAVFTAESGSNSVETLHIYCGENGVCTPSSGSYTYNSGDTVDIQVVANSGYVIDKVIVNGVEKHLFKGKWRASIPTVILGETLVRVTFVEYVGSPEELVDLSLSASVTEQEGMIVIIIQNIDESFVGKSIEVWLNSDPIKIGESLIVAGKRSYEITAQIPCSVPAGNHTVTLKLDGKTIGNQVVLGVTENSACSNYNSSGLPATGINIIIILTVVGSLIGLGIFVIAISKKELKK